MIKAGEKFPEFSLLNQDGKTIKLTDYASKWVVVYFYPKDDTPSCTIQANAFTANKEQFDKANIKVLGVSQDATDSHKNFCNKFNLTIDLLADTNCELLKKLGIGQTEYNGVMYWDRTTFIVDPKGDVAKVYEKVKAEGHDQVLLNDIEQLKLQTATR